MLKRDAGRFIIISLLLFFQCASSGFAMQTTGAESAPTQEISGGQASSALPEVKTYEELRHAISEARAASRVRVEKAVEQERVREAWEIGRLIDAHVLLHKERADYGKQVLERLAGDLGMGRTELYYMLEFARAYPIVPHAGQLSWSEYRELLAVNASEERNALTERAEKENWSRDRLRKEVKAVIGKSSEGESASEKLAPSKPGKPGTHTIILAKTGPYAGELAIDLGFSNYIQLAEVVEDASPFAEGDVVQSISPFSKGGKGDLTEISPSPSLQKRGTEADLYTYRACVNRVLDGDTIEAVIDLGFGITTTQTLRLRGIDAPELPSSDGVEAKKALEEMLKMSGNGERGTQTKAESVIATSLLSGDSKTRGKQSQVLIKTVKSDKYDRYLADVFVGDAYINQKLLDEGLAVRVEE